MKNLKPFLIIHLLWSVLGAALQPFLSGSVLWFLLMTALAGLNLFAMGAFFFFLFEHIAPQKKKRKNQTLYVKIAVSGLAKLLCFGGLIVVLVLGKEIPAPTLLTGLTTMAVVPLMLGLYTSLR
jgi:hypothetical protein